MSRFSFKAKNTLGQLVEGQRAAGSDKEVVALLKGEGLIAFSITEIREGVVSREKKKKETGRGGAIRQQEIAVFCRQLATLVNAGVSILDAIEDISDIVTNLRFQSILKGIASDIREGGTLSDGMKKYQKAFGRVFVYMVAAGEKSGKLAKVLHDMAAYLESSVKLKRKVRAASAYPMFIGGFFLVAVSGLVLFLVPRFKDMFSQFGAELPLPTRIVMGFSETVVRNLPLLVVLTVAAALAVSFTNRTPSGRLFFDSLKLRLPIFGELIKKVVLARFFQSLATLLKSGTDIVSSLDVASKVTNNALVEEKISLIRARVIEGSTLSKEMEKIPLFPKMVVRMTAVGEKSGQMDEMFVKLADYYDDEVDGAVAVMSSVIEPLLIIMLGGVVGAVIVVMYLPMFKIAMAVMNSQGG